jgi:adhesin transport system membrane fusion protein
MTALDYEDELVGRSRSPSVVIWAIAATLVIFLLWAAFAWVDEIVRAPGQVVSSSRPQIIQNLEGGILAELNVAEGDIVEDGQILARLYGTQYQATVDELDDQIAALDIRRLRLEAEMEGKAEFDLPPDLEARVPAIAASERALLSARLTEYQARVEGTEAVAEQTAKELELIQRMFDREIAPLIELTRAKKAHSDAKNKLSEAITTTPCSWAKLWKARVLGPGMGSARSKYRCSSDWQKYWERTNSWVHKMLAPSLAACAPASRHNLRFSSGSGPQACCKRPRVTDRVFGRGFMVAF